jgi:hypothetical protein
MGYLNVDDAINQLILTGRKINSVVDTGGWSPTSSIDEQMSLCSIETMRDEYTDEEINDIFQCLGINPSDDVYHVVSSHTGYSIILFYDRSELILFVQPESDDWEEWSKRTEEASKKLEIQL